MSPRLFNGGTKILVIDLENGLRIIFVADFVNFFTLAGTHKETIWTINDYAACRADITIGVNDALWELVLLSGCRRQQKAS